MLVQVLPCLEKADGAVDSSKFVTTVITVFAVVNIDVLPTLLHVGNGTMGWDLIECD